MKKVYNLLFIGFLFFSSILICNASTNVLDRNDFSNYGVNKKWDVNGGNLDNVLNTPFVDASEKIYDFADILTDHEEQQLYYNFLMIKQKTGMDVVFLSDKFSYYDDDENETYATDFYDYNDFGISSEYYDGIILFRNANPADPYYAIYSFGEAQFYYDNERIDRILDDMYASFSTQNYSNGLNIFCNRIIEYYEMGIPSKYENSYLDEDGMIVFKEVYKFPWLTATIVALIGTTILIGFYVKRNKMVRKASKASEYLNKNSVAILTRMDKFIRTHTSSYTVSSSSGSSGSYGGGGSSRGSSGGGHSGGGRHG